MSTDFISLWRAIGRAGGIDAYVREQLTAKGFLVKRRPTDDMSKDELSRYKQQLKDEAAEKRRLEKESWLAYRATHIVHVGEGVYWNDADDFDRFDHPKADERRAENALPQLDKPEQLAEALGLSIPELRWMSFHRDAATKLHYRRFTIPKRTGGERPIWAPLPKLKTAQRWILREIVERLPIHGAAHGFVAGRSIATNAAIHANARIVVKVDVKDFFPTVTLRRVKGVFRKAGYREQVATLLALLCTEAPRTVEEHEGKTWYLALGPRCLPQGAPTSPALTNVVCLGLDRRLTALAQKLGWRYSRYADDMTFSLPQPPPKAKHKAPRLGALLGCVQRVLADEGFRIHPDKTRVLRDGGRQQITGLIVNEEGGPRAPRELRRRVRAALHHLKVGRPLPEGETLDRVQGLIAYIRMTQPELGQKLADELAAVRPQA